MRKFNLIAALTMLFFAFASEARARPFDEMPGVRVREESDIRRSLAASKKKDRRLAGAFGPTLEGRARFFGGQIHVDHQCGADKESVSGTGTNAASFESLCLLRIKDTKTGATCYSVTSPVHTQGRLACVD